jgi:hypothetical protein
MKKVTMAWSCLLVQLLFAASNRFSVRRGVWWCHWLFLSAFFLRVDANSVRWRALCAPRALPGPPEGQVAISSTQQPKLPYWQLSRAYTHKTRELEMEYLKEQGCHHIILYITQLGIDIKELISGSGDQRMNNAVSRKIFHLGDPVGIASVITRSLGGKNLQDQERALDKFKEHVTATTFKRYKKKNGAWDFEAWCVKMFKLLEQLQLFGADTVSVKQVWMDIKIMLRESIEDFQGPLRQRARHTDLRYVNEIADKHVPMSLLEDMTDTLTRTAQEEDFEPGNSSKNGRADDSDDDDRDRSSKKKNRRHKKTRRERTELAQVANTTSDSNDKKGLREVGNKMIKKLNEMKGITCSKCDSFGPGCWDHGYFKDGKLDKPKQDATWKEFKGLCRKSRDDPAQVAKIEEVESDEERAGSVLMDQVALLVMRQTVNILAMTATRKHTTLPHVTIATSGFTQITSGRMEP